MQRIIIIGVDGQDGRLLFDLLKCPDFELIGIDVQSISTYQSTWSQIVDICNYDQIATFIKVTQPHKIYHLAAFHHSSEKAEQLSVPFVQKSVDVNTNSLLYLLDAIRQFSPHTKLFYAASSHVFGNPTESPQTETTPMKPITIYGLTKLNGLLLCKQFSDRYNVFASVGILYNHESHLRAKEFISKKIISSALAIKQGKKKTLTIQNIHRIVDWGYAPDYVKAMRDILDMKIPSDFIIATGISHTVLDFLNITFHSLNLNWEDYVQPLSKEPSHDILPLVGNASKLIHQTGWATSVNFEGMIQKLLYHEGVENESKFSVNYRSNI